MSDNISKSNGRLEQLLNASVYLGSIAYGLHLAICIACLYKFFQKKTYWKLFLFTSALFVLGTVNFACSINWLTRQDYAGNPMASLDHHRGNPAHIVGTVSGMTINTLGGGMLLFRTTVIWSNHWLVIILPYFAYLSSIALAIMTILHSIHPQFSFPEKIGFNFSVAYYVITLAFNVILAVMTVSRLLWMRKTISKAMGGKYGRTYTGVVATIVESALPYDVLSLIFIVLYAKENDAWNIFIPSIFQFECIAQDLIILRVLHGHSWSKDTWTSLQISPAQTDQDNSINTC